MLRSLIAAAIALAVFTSAADARSKRAAGLHPDCNVTMPCTPPASAAQVREGERQARGNYIARQLGIGGVAPRPRTVGRSTSTVAPKVYTKAPQILPHPTGCPRRAFCACGLSVRIFGRPIGSLMTARAWYQFERASPSPGMVAVRPHHVFQLESHIAGSTWLVYDANSGGRLTRLHARSIAGYTIVNPQRQRFASAR